MEQQMCEIELRTNQEKILENTFYCHKHTKTHFDCKRDISSNTNGTFI